MCHRQSISARRLYLGTELSLLLPFAEHPLLVKGNMSIKLDRLSQESAAFDEELTPFIQTISSKMLIKVVRSETWLRR